MGRLPLVPPNARPQFTDMPHPFTAPTSALTTPNHPARPAAGLPLITAGRLLGNRPRRHYDCLATEPRYRGTAITAPTSPPERSRRALPTRETLATLFGNVYSSPNRFIRSLEAVTFRWPSMFHGHSPRGSRCPMGGARVGPDMDSAPMRTGRLHRVTIGLNGAAPLQPCRGWCDGGTPWPGAMKRFGSTRRADLQ